MSIVKYQKISTPIFLMLIGIPGSGKTTWVKETIKEKKFVVVCPDDIRKEITGSISNLSQDKLVWSLAKRKVSEYLQDEKNVILDATNINYYYRQLFIKNLPHCKLMAKIFNLTPELARKRISEDVDKGRDRSKVPDDIINKMFKQFVNYCTPSRLKKEGFEVIV